MQKPHTSASNQIFFFFVKGGDSHLNLRKAIFYFTRSEMFGEKPIVGMFNALYVYRKPVKLIVMSYAVGSKV